MTVVGERKQAILCAAVSARRYEDGVEKQARAAASRLHMDGYLARDPKDGSIWYPTDKAFVELRAGANEARALLDSGDVMRARDLAELVYGQSKAVGRSASKILCSESLDACRRIQVDAAKVVGHALHKIADAWDDLAEDGKVLKGRPKSVPDENAFSAEQAGLSRKQIYEARKIRDTEKAEPGFIDRFFDERLEAGLEPTLSSLINHASKSSGHAVGLKSRTEEERGNNAYFTPPEAMRALLAVESFSSIVKEPACGKGHISRFLEDSGYDVMLADLVDYGTADRNGELQHVGDFLASVAGDSAGVDIVTNPPYGRKILNPFVAHALREHKPRKMALLMNLTVLCGCENEDREFFMEECPPSRIYVNKRRLPMMHQDGWDGNIATSQMETAWYVWQRNDDGSYGDGYPRVIRLDYEQFANSEPLPPGAGGFVRPQMSFAPAIEEDNEFKRETPRIPAAELVERFRAKAMIWMAGRESFDAVELRKPLITRPLIAEEIISTFEREGLVTTIGDGRFCLSENGHLALAATAGALLAGFSADDVAAMAQGDA